MASIKPKAKPNTPTPVVPTPAADAQAAGSGGKMTTIGADDGKEYILGKLVVVSTVEGFRRAGRAWSKEPTEVPAEEFTADQIEALLSDPALIVTPVAAAD